MRPNAIADELARLRDEWKQLRADLAWELARPTPDTRRCAFLREEARAVLGAIIILQRVQDSLQLLD